MGKITATAAGLLLSGAVVLATPGSALSEPGTAGDGRRPADQSLGSLAKRLDLRFATAVDMAALADDAAYRQKVVSEFSGVTAENVMKWEVLEPQRGVYDWEQADRLVAFARQNRQTVRGHVLVWHNQLPAWLTEGDFSAQELRALLRKHIHETVRHFRGKVWHWDVVNEAFNEDGTLRDTIWLRNLGPGYIADAFRWAHEADPRVRLYYNDYNIENVNAKSDAVHNLVRSLRAQGVPIHGVGVQGHHTVGSDLASMQRNLQRFDDLGVETSVTEADVRMVMPADATKLQAQANVYSTMLESCLATPRCTSFTVWGFTDKYSWVPDWFDGEGAANIMDENFQPKPAYNALRTDLTLASSHRRP
ncbi:endo-1,4-beta-xylanase [Thermomonospora amylolytica]|uniref:endo-1,4-beta-xylanase n=1 Tax=Thermomonospora amylolytica TaxID=1411117 RepID=UPI000E6D44C7|nr:endo-1,4-beta-xylanase [Thermomonospora amylolytica]